MKHLDDCFILDPKKCYYAGTDEKEANALVAQLNTNPRANIEQQDEGLYVCWGDHERAEDCEFVLFIEYETGRPLFNGPTPTSMIGKMFPTDKFTTSV